MKRIKDMSAPNGITQSLYIPRNIIRRQEARENKKPKRGHDKPVSSVQLDALALQGFLHRDHLVKHNKTEVGNLKYES